MIYDLRLTILLLLTLLGFSAPAQFRVPAPGSAVALTNAANVIAGNGSLLTGFTLSQMPGGVVTNIASVQYVVAFSTGTNGYYCSNCPVSSWSGFYSYAGTLSLPATNSGTVAAASFPYYSLGTGTNYLINLSSANDGAEQVLQTNAVLSAVLSWNGSAFVWVCSAGLAAFDAQGGNSMADGSWFNDLSQTNAPNMAVYGSVVAAVPGLTTNCQFTFGSTRTNTLCFTNGILLRITQP